MIIKFCNRTHSRGYVLCHICHLTFCPSIYVISYFGKIFTHIVFLIILLNKIFCLRGTIFFLLAIIRWWLCCSYLVCILLFFALYKLFVLHFYKFSIPLFCQLYMDATNSYQCSYVNNANMLHNLNRKKQQSTNT